MTFYVFWVSEIGIKKASNARPFQLDCKDLKHRDLPRIVNEYLPEVFNLQLMRSLGCFSFMNKIHFTTLPGDGIGRR